MARAASPPADRSAPLPSPTSGKLMFDQNRGRKREGGRERERERERERKCAHRESVHPAGL